MAEDESGGNEQPIVIKKIVKGGGHHGGAWKVAYADFVTAMMAFFLLMWLLSMSSDEQLKGIADYFSPSVVSAEDSGAGGVMGGVSVSPEGAKVSDNTPPIPPPTVPSAAGSALRDPAKAAEDLIREELKKKEEAEFEKAKEALEQAMQENPDLANLAENLIIDMTAEGLRIQVVDAEGNAMFPSGSAQMFEKTKTLMAQVAQIILALPNEISVKGHTDSTAYGAGAEYTNWELSSDRANASRRVLQEGEIPAERINNVVGKADTEHLLPEDPTNARNRRISITLLREELTDPEGYQKRVQEELAKQKEAMIKEAPPEEEKVEEEEETITPPPLQTEGIPTTNGEPLDDSTSDGYFTPSVPTPETGDFERSEGDVVFP